MEKVTTGADFISPESQGPSGLSKWKKQGPFGKGARGTERGDISLTQEGSLFHQPQADSPLLLRALTVQ